MKLLIILLLLTVGAKAQDTAINICTIIKTVNSPCADRLQVSIKKISGTLQGVISWERQMGIKNKEYRAVEAHELTNTPFNVFIFNVLPGDRIVYNSKYTSMSEMKCFIYDCGKQVKKL